MGLLEKSFAEHSIVWIVISAGVGGFIGAALKFFFEQVITPQLDTARAAELALAKYSSPLLRAADGLDRRLQNLIEFADRGWFDDEGDEYYRLSTLYVMGVYFGWCRILEQETYLEFGVSKKRVRQFNIHFGRVFKSLTGFYYFSKVTLEPGPEWDIEKATVPRLALTAIGELMIRGQAERPNAPDRIIGFVEFCRQYREAPEFKEWFRYLSPVLSKLRKAKDDVGWNRLVLLAVNVRLFVHYLDRGNRRTAHREIRYLSLLHEEVAECLRQEIEESGVVGIVVT